MPPASTRKVSAASASRAARKLLFAFLSFAPHRSYEMKSAYELAMERLEKSAPSVSLTNEQKEQIAEIDMIGKKLAHALVESRTQQGGFENWEALESVPGLDAMKIAELQRAARLGTAAS